jgi:hypothetical protein
MKVIIYLASDEITASRNFLDLVDVRSKVKTDKVVSSILEVRQGDLYPAPRYKTEFEGIDPSERQSVTVELVAHGNPHRPREILTYSNKKPLDMGDSNHMYINPLADPANSQVFVGVTPPDLARFFTNNAFKERYKFSRLTLFCCSSDKFALELSGIIKSILITAYKERIFIDKKSGKAKCVDGFGESEMPTPEQLDNAREAIPQIFHNGKDQTNNAEFRFEAKEENKTTAEKPFSFGTLDDIMSEVPVSSSSSARSTPSNTPSALFKGTVSSSPQPSSQKRTAPSSATKKDGEPANPPLQRKSN